MKVKLQGGLSDAVVRTRMYQEYVRSSFVAGYVGSSARTIARDKALEKALAGQGLGPAGIATWLTSGDGRHLMDGVDRKTMPEQFEERVGEYVYDAFQKVTIWSHPDHAGSVASTNVLRDKIRAKFGAAS